MLSAIYILDFKGKVLIARDYRGDIPLEVCAFTADFLSTLLGGRVAFSPGQDACLLGIISMIHSAEPL